MEKPQEQSPENRDSQPDSLPPGNEGAPGPAAPSTVSEPDAPLESVFLTEIQEMNARLNVIGSTVMAIGYLAGIAAVCCLFFVATRKSGSGPSLGEVR